MKLLRRPSAGEIAAVATLGVVGVLMVARGDRLYSPGALNDAARSNASLGGVSSHADTGRNCAACHAPIWSKETMADRCLSCHKDVRGQIDAGSSLHGKFGNGMECRKCHSEHKGAHGSMTSLAHFDHDLAAFKLTGAHVKADCQSCHKTAAYKGTPRTCVGCHAEPATPQVHKQRYGNACASCHGTTTWKNSSFRHTVFSITHGQRRTSSPSTCATCHKDANSANYKTYTCYGCHKHQPAGIARIHERRNIVEFQDCIRCHSRRGRRAEAGPERAEAVCRACAVPEDR